MATAKLIDIKPDVTQTAWYKATQLIITAAAVAGRSGRFRLVGYLATTRWFGRTKTCCCRICR